jgi:precorrin-6B methylase 2
MTGVPLRRARLALLLARSTVAALVVIRLAGVPAAQSAAEIERITKLIGLRPGMVVADIGAGAGRLTVALARLAGPSGRVYSTEIDSDRLADIRSAVEDAGLRNVVVIEGHASRTNLPEACCDALVLRNVYHHFREPERMAASLFASLRPGGRLLVIDFAPRRLGPARGSSTESRGDRPAAGGTDRARGEAHGVAPEAVERELEGAGFEMLERIDDWPGRRAFAVLARRPGAS